MATTSRPGAELGGVRLGAAALDGLLALLVAWVSLFVSLGFLYPVFPFLAVASYFAVGFARGATVGMRSCGLELVNAGTGGSPSLPAAIGRALVTAVSYGGWILTLAFLFGDQRDGGSTTMDIAIAVTGAAIAAAALLGHLAQFVDRDGRSLQDRLFGLVVVARGTPATPDAAAESSSQ